jgi:hypothetical protein
MMDEGPRWTDSLAVRTVLTLDGLLFCYVLHLIMARIGRAAHRVVAALVLLPLVTQAYALSSVFIALTFFHRPPQPASGETILQLGFIFGCFSTWLALYLAIIGAHRNAREPAVGEDHAASKSVAAPQPDRYETEIWVRHRVSGFVCVVVKDIDWIAAEVDYVRLVVGQQSYLLRGTLKDMQRRLDPALFARIHRSTIVQASRVRAIRRDGEAMIAVLDNGARLRVGRAYAKTVRSRLVAQERDRPGFGAGIPT